MRRIKRPVFNLFAFGLLAIAIYLNFFYKEEGIRFQSKPEKGSTAAASQIKPQATSIQH